MDDEEEGSTCSLSPQSVSSLSLYSEEERDSVSCLVRTVLSAMRGHFVSGTPEGVKQVFAVNSRDKGTFDPLYMKFEELLRILQEHICTYLTVSILYSTRINALISTCMYSKICVIHCNKIYSTLLCVYVCSIAYCLLILCKCKVHLDRERIPERVVHVHAKAAGLCMREYMYMCIVIYSVFVFAFYSVLILVIFLPSFLLSLPFSLSPSPFLLQVHLAILR